MIILFYGGWGESTKSVIYSILRRALFWTFLVGISQRVHEYRNIESNGHRNWKIEVLTVRIPVSSPYFQVRMDTSGSYTLVKARTIFTESAHPHDTQITLTLYKSHTRLTSTVYAPNLRVQFTRHVQDLQAYFTRVQFTPPPKRTI